MTTCLAQPYLPVGGERESSPLHFAGILERIEPEVGTAAIIAFSVRGMTVNTSRVDLLDDMLARVFAGRPDAGVRLGILRRIAERIPLPRRCPARVPRAFRAEPVPPA